VSTLWPRRSARGRVAPPTPDVAASGTESPPHGWIELDASPADRGVEWIDRALLATTRSMAEQISRRRLLKYAGQAGLLIGLGATTTFARPERARGYDTIFSTCDPLGDPPTGPCGPNGLCPSGNCSNGNCANSNKKRNYAGSTCCSGCTGTTNCWRENCCDNPNWNSLMKCCDCCYTASPDTECTDCVGAQGDKCICRAKVGAAC
jgi:hypothetical protein